jgi:general secretion pathway protein L
LSSKLPTHVRRKLTAILHWWLRQWSELLPERSVKWFVAPGRPILVVACDESGPTLSLMDDARGLTGSTLIRSTVDPSHQIDEFLAVHGFDRQTVRVAVRIAQEKVFHRTMVLPLEAEGALEQIVAQDLARKTPFRAAEVYQGYRADRSIDPDKIVVRQWITRRAYVDEVATAFELKAESVSLLFTGDRDLTSVEPSFVSLRSDQSAGSTWLKRTALALSLSACTLALVAAGRNYLEQEIAMEQVQSQLAIAKGKAQRVRATMDKIEQIQAGLNRLRSRKANSPGLLDVWQEMTRVLPAHSWLIEMRMTETPRRAEPQVTIMGFSAAATQMVGLVEQSPLFGEAALTAPVALDPTEGRERFTLQAMAKRREPVKEAMR